MTSIHDDKILILDFGSQYTQLIARAVRALGVYCELHPYDIEEQYVRDFAPKAIVLSGSPNSVLEKDSPKAPDIVFSLGCPVLGICYGMQTMAVQLGGKVTAGAHSEFGHAKLDIKHSSPLLARLGEDHPESTVSQHSVWMSHGDQVSQVPDGFTVVAQTNNTPHAVMADEKRKFYGLQFHPEVTHTPDGQKILAAFLFDIAGCDALWKPAQIIEESVALIQKKVGKDKVLLGLSGGVDSAVVAMLLHQAIGDQLQCIFVDTGLLRLGEAIEVKRIFQDHFKVPLTCIEASDRFLGALKGIADPEQKRRIIGREFVAVFEQAAKDYCDAKWLAQGTIYPDVIESACAKTDKAQVIKTHHNVGGLPEKMHLKILEPLRELFKDEVRKIGLALGLPASWINRHPFPGPGLGVRMLGEIQEDALDTLRCADAIFIEELRLHDLYQAVSQAFAVFLPVKSVGVMGDGRVYAPVIALRAVQTIDFMTAQWAQLPMSFLAHVSHRIVNEVKGVSRVVYDISGKPPATIEWE